MFFCGRSFLFFSSFSPPPPTHRRADGKGSRGEGRGGDESRVSRGGRRRRLSKKIPETGTTFAAGDVGGGGGGRRGGSGLWKLEGGEIAGEILSLPILLLPLSPRTSLDREEEENIVQEGSFRICFCSRVRTLVKHKVMQQDFLYSSYRSREKMCLQTVNKENRAPPPPFFLACVFIFIVRLFFYRQSNSPPPSGKWRHSIV